MENLTEPLDGYTESSLKIRPSIGNRETPEDDEEREAGVDLAPIPRAHHAICLDGEAEASENFEKIKFLEPAHLPEVDIVQLGPWAV